MSTALYNTGGLRFWTESQIKTRDRKPEVPHDAGHDALAQALTAIACFKFLDAKKVDNGDAREYSKKVDG